jgi:hypothetical protein
MGINSYKTRWILFIIWIPLFLMIIAIGMIGSSLLSTDLFLNSYFIIPSLGVLIIINTYLAKKIESRFDDLDRHSETKSNSLFFRFVDWFYNLFS